MIGIVSSILGLFAVVAWLVAVREAFLIVSKTPKGTRFQNYTRLGWWRFHEIQAAAGPDVAPHIATYKRAFIAFFVCIGLGLVIGGLVSLQAQD